MSSCVGLIFGDGEFIVTTNNVNIVYVVSIGIFLFFCWGYTWYLSVLFHFIVLMFKSMLREYF